ncbi:kinase-like protein [Piedraia hortae CBS 480.64]|uniref:non-specific serine/threonine protein kinase n=1 Tax=Piedraia hortae CBS 480.64 TaxID=1314780 RepID=A0A6A7C9K4_9PEZI|nr:kinase-like protein [Piedraia hortae CBS 480.64]
MTLSGAEEKAIRHTMRARDGRVNSSTRRHYGFSSYAPLYSTGRLPRDGTVSRAYSRSRSRSPFRADRAVKRRREDDHYPAKDAPDARRFRSRYEDDPAGRVRDRDRSRSPFRHGRQPEPSDLSKTAKAAENPEAAEPKDASKPPEPTTDQADEHETEDATPKLSEEEEIQLRRKRREELAAKLSGQPLLVQTIAGSILSPVTPQDSAPPSVTTPRSLVVTPAFTVNDDEELANRRQPEQSVDDGPSAADYNPNMDMQEDRRPTNTDKQEHQPAKDFDMFAEDDDDDMFAATPAARVVGKTLDQSLIDNWDYPDGHLRIIQKERLDGRYVVQQQVGKGTFATVVRALDEETDQEVAIKIAANNDTMFKAGQKEMDFLRLLNEKDPEDKKHIIRLLRRFQHKGHLCIVFEALSADLREVLKKFGRNVGLNLNAIRVYAQQTFKALEHLQKCKILHADLKPDNLLVSEKRDLLKVCDLGTATFSDDAEVTPYLVSRFYRAPEVILGMPLNHALDMWSVGCTLYELYTGRILFTGADNNQMLRVMQECRGKIPMRMLKRSTLADRYFDIDGQFYAQERDRITGNLVPRPVYFDKTAAGKGLKARLEGNAKGLSPRDMRDHIAFVDLLEKCLQLDPLRRIQPNDALHHPFVSPESPHTSEMNGRKGFIAMQTIGVPRRAV